MLFRSHGACSLSAHAAQALGCSTGNHPWSALGCLYFPGPSCSGSSTRVVLRGADSIGPVFCALPSSEQLLSDEVFGERGRCAVTSSVPAAWFSGCTTGPPSQADDCPSFNRLPFCFVKDDPELISCKMEFLWHLSDYWWLPRS